MHSILQKTITDLKLASYSPRTVEAYSYHVKKLLERSGKDPRLLTEDELKQYFLYLKYKKKLSGSASAQAISGIKFMFEKTLDMQFKVFGIVKNPRGKKLPVVLTRDEIRKVLKRIRILRHRACLTLIYTCGLRLHEATNISPADIDSKRMLVHIKAGKGRRDRLVPFIAKHLILSLKKTEIFATMHDAYKRLKISLLHRYDLLQYSLLICQPAFEENSLQTLSITQAET